MTNLNHSGHEAATKGKENRKVRGGIKEGKREKRTEQRKKKEKEKKAELKGRQARETGKGDLRKEEQMRKKKMNRHAK